MYGTSVTSVDSQAFIICLFVFFFYVEQGFVSVFYIQYILMSFLAGRTSLLPEAKTRERVKGVI